MIPSSHALVSLKPARQAAIQAISHVESARERGARLPAMPYVRTFLRLLTGSGRLNATVASKINGCIYCASVHARKAAQLAKDETAVDTLLAVTPGEDLRDGQSPRWQAEIDAAAALSVTPPALNADHLAALKEGQSVEAARGAVMEAVCKAFRPEFLNRVDETVVFLPLRRNQIARIVDLQVNRLRKRLEDRKIRLELTDEARKFIADAGYDPVYGARPLKRYVQQAVETPLAKELVGGKIRDGQTVTVDAKDEQLVFTAA